LSGAIPSKALTLSGVVNGPGVTDDSGVAAGDLLKMGIAACSSAVGGGDWLGVDGAEPSPLNR
jgi:hypothetical protein